VQVKDVLAMEQDADFVHEGEKKQVGIASITLLGGVASS
jgi:hypothetical protein